MKVRRLNENGIEKFIEFLDSLSSEVDIDIPSDILENPEYSTQLEIDVNVELNCFSSRYEAAEYLTGKLEPKVIPNIYRDKGLWAWLSLFYFEILCPFDKDGNRKPYEIARWIPAIGNYQKYYRHLLLGPYRIYLAHMEKPERAMSLLSNPVHKPGELAEQLSASQEIVTNAAIIETATYLYIDPDTKSRKRGAAGKGPGSARRIPKFWNQFDVTWDLYGMTANEILDLLPSEFDRWREN